MAWAVVLVPLVGAGLTAVVRRPPGTIALATLAATLATGVWAASAELTAAWGWGGALELTVAVDGFARVMVVLVPAVALPVVAYAAVTEAAGRRRLLALMVAFVAGIELLVVAADLLTLLIGWELVGAVSWALIGHHWGDADNARAAGQAFITTRVGDLGLYVAAGAAFAGTGSFSYATLGDLSGWQLHTVAAGLLVAAAAKSAQLPFSPWLFSAMAGPTPVSALLHSATLVSAGAYVLIRLTPGLTGAGWLAPTIATVGLATAAAGGLVAATQAHVKRILAGSTSAQYGLMFLAVGVGYPAAAAVQLVAHALFKSLLFLAAGTAIRAAGTSKVTRMSLWGGLPLLGVVAAVGALALAAVPPLGGAWSKEQVIAAAASHSAVLGGGALLAAVLTALYASRFWLLAFGPHRGDSPAPTTGRRDLPRPGRLELGAIGVLASASLLLGLVWIPATKPTVATIVGSALPTTSFRELALALTVLMVGLATALLLWHGDRLTTLGMSARLQRYVAGWFGIPTVARVAVAGPVLGLSSQLGRFDQRVVDAGVRAAAALATGVSRWLSRWGELTFDGIRRGVAGVALRLARGVTRFVETLIDAAVTAVASVTDSAAGASRRSDDAGVDRAVEDLARFTGTVGAQSRKVQTGQSHHYFAIVVAGLAAITAALAMAR
jgi:NADH-quinone oxidoreductase subunit L